MKKLSASGIIFFFSIKVTKSQMVTLYRNTFNVRIVPLITLALDIPNLSFTSCINHTHK